MKFATFLLIPPPYHTHIILDMRKFKPRSVLTHGFASGLRGGGGRVGIKLIFGLVQPKFIFGLVQPKFIFGLVQPKFIFGLVNCRRSRSLFDFLFVSGFFRLFTFFRSVRFRQKKESRWTSRWREECVCLTSSKFWMSLLFQSDKRFACTLSTGIIVVSMSRKISVLPSWQV